MDQLKGKKVGGVLGDGEQDWFAAFRKAEISYQFVFRIEQNIKKLRAGRIDAMVSFMPDVAAYEDELSYAKDKPLFSSFDMMTCHNNSKGNQFIEKISAALKEMKRDGTMKAILGDLYLDYDENERPKY
ncbi:MAG: amino acid ABC transporter substrate-binding protein [Desulfobacterales bacterium]|nr:amino acid ABC transporter substrate-binding protein [Desulfobacterales bacterium]